MNISRENKIWCGIIGTAALIGGGVLGTSTHMHNKAAQKEQEVAQGYDISENGSYSEAELTRLILDKFSGSDRKLSDEGYKQALRFGEDNFYYGTASSPSMHEYFSALEQIMLRQELNTQSNKQSEINTEVPQY